MRLCVFVFKEQLENESVKLQQTEEESSLKEKKFESIITVKEDKIRHLKKQLKEITEAPNCTRIPRYEKEVRILKRHQPLQVVAVVVSLYCSFACK